MFNKIHMEIKSRMIKIPTVTCTRQWAIRSSGTMKRLSDCLFTDVLSQAQLWIRGWIMIPEAPLWSKISQVHLMKQKIYSNSSKKSKRTSPKRMQSLRELFYPPINEPVLNQSRFDLDSPRWLISGSILTCRTITRTKESCCKICTRLARILE